MSDFRGKLQVVKADDERRLVTAIYSVVTKADGTPIVDHQGDVIPIDELEIADIESFIDGGRARGGEMHETIGGVHVVQHFTLSQEQWQSLGKAMGVELPAMPEVGIVKLFVEDDGTWKGVKSGDLSELSIAGSAKSEALNDE